MDDNSDNVALAINVPASDEREINNEDNGNNARY